MLLMLKSQPKILHLYVVFQVQQQMVFLAAPQTTHFGPVSFMHVG
jgi:hypothetical protein